MAKLQKEITDIEKKMNAGVEPDALIELSKTHHDLKDELDTLELRWLELSEV